jgi:[ribosomal protein S5]-alanine N-acetyltransferase
VTATSGTSVRGSRVTLRPFRPEELGVLVENRRRRPDIAYPLAEEPDVEVLRRRVERSGSFADGELLLAIETSGRLVGEIQGRQPRHGLPPGVFELGVELFELDDRDKGLGAEAVALMASHLFDEHGAHRVQATTDVENLPMRAVLNRLGFEEEGVLRGFMPAAEGARDYAMYATTKNDWATRRPAWIRTD